MLTETDLAVGELLVGKVRAAFPQHNVIDEEAGVIDNGSRFTWVIDPIDGTSNFASGVPTYGIMIGLLDDDAPLAGGFALPYFGEIYLAEQGMGAFCNSEPIHVCSETDLAKVLVACGIDGHQEDPKRTQREAAMLGEIILQIRNMRSSNSVFDAAQVSRGRYGGYLNATSKIWDNVAQQVVLEEAGGIYTDIYGRPIDYSEPLKRVHDNYTWCMAPPALHAQLQAIIHGR